MGEEIRVNFGKPMPLFPIPGVVLLPHALQPLQIFEPRYRQMVSDCLDQMVGNRLTTAGQIAMATFEPMKAGSGESFAVLRPAVCVGQIMHHEPLVDDRCHIVLQGICRGRIVSVNEPDGDRLYRTARLAIVDRPDLPQAELPGVRETIRRLLRGPQLKRMCAADTVKELLDHQELPMSALLELVGFTLIKNEEVKYRLLAEPNVKRRAATILGELNELDRIVARADHQNWRDWPKGLSWN